MKTHLLVFLSFAVLGLWGCGEAEVGVNIGPELRAQGITQTTAKVDGQNAISIYLISKSALKATLVAKAMNENGQEIGRATGELNLAADDAKLVSFKFGAEVDATAVKSYLVDLQSVNE